MGLEPSDLLNFIPHLASILTAHRLTPPLNPTPPLTVCFYLAPTLLLRYCPPVNTLVISVSKVEQFSPFSLCSSLQGL